MWIAILVHDEQTATPILDEGTSTNMKTFDSVDDVNDHLVGLQLEVSPDIVQLINIETGETLTF